MRTILVPTDFSKCSAEAVKYAIQFAQKTERKIIFFHSTFLLIPTKSSTTAYLYAVKSDKENKMKILMKSIDDAYHSLNIKREEYQTKFIIKFGNSVVENVMETINEQFIDLIIMGTLGATGFRKILFGSNTAKVIEQAYCPVLAVPGKFKFTPINKIAYATLDMDTLKKELKGVVSIAQKLNASIDIVHIIGGTKSAIKPEIFDVNKFITALSKRLKFYNFGFYIIDGKDRPLADEINKFAAHQKSDMLVMLTQKRGFFEKLFNPSKTTELAYNLHVPLLAIKQ